LVIILRDPSAGDVFFDLKGDPFAGEGGLEYLFGYAFTDNEGNSAYTAEWAFSREQEKQIFERFIDFVMDRLEQHPGLHIYHFAPYEPAALKRLMGRYASREEEIDFLLRSKCFVDLYSLVRNGLRASVESYSIKKLEPLYGFERSTPLSYANSALANVQACLELGDIEFINENDRNVVVGYNRDDCVSTWRLRDWLETQRDALIASGIAVPRPAADRRRAHRNGGQISVARSTHRHLLSDDVELCGCSARYGVSLQPQPLKCSDLACKVHLHPCGFALGI
jgi:predicted RecB family nuclease